VSTKEAMLPSSEGEPIIPPPPRRMVRKVKVPPIPPSVDAPVPSSSSGHVSAFSFFFLIIRTRVAPEPIVGWLQPSVGTDIFVTYLDEFFASSLQPIQAAVDTVMDFANQFIRMEAENARLREVIKSSTEQLEKANKLATEAQGEATNLKKELDLLKAKMKEEEQLKIEAQAQADKKEGDLRKSVESLLGKFLRLLYLSIFAKFSSSYNTYSL
jgi:hypothetical protein